MSTKSTIIVSIIFIVLAIACFAIEHIFGVGMVMVTSGARSSPCGDYGDVDDNGYVDDQDADLVMQYGIGAVSLSPEQLTRADVSGNGSVSAYDAALILQYHDAIIDTFPVCPSLYITGPVNFVYLNMHGGKITGLPATAAGSDGAAVAYVNNRVAGIVGVTTAFVDGLEASTMDYIGQTVNVDVSAWMSWLSAQEGQILSAETSANALNANLVDRGWWHHMDAGDCMLWENSNSITPFCPIEVNCIDCTCFRNTMEINGDLTVSGYFYVSGTKNFKIDHPTKEGMDLVHAAIEGPEVAVFYRGEGQLVNGKAIVELPEYFEALTREEGRTVFLTPKFEVKGEPVSQLASFPVKNGKIKVIAIGQNNPEQKFFWEVKAVRADVAPLEAERGTEAME